MRRAHFRNTSFPRQRESSTRLARDPRHAGDARAPIEELVVDGDIDSIHLRFPDYIKGLKTFHAEVMPLLQRHELVLAS